MLTSVGPATSAKLRFPTNIAIDTINNLVYIVDSGNYRIRVVNRNTGNISTIAGSGSWGYSGDGGTCNTKVLLL